MRLRAALRHPFSNLCPALLILAVLSSPGCTTYRILRYNYSSIEDYKIFPARAVRAAPEPFRFAEPSVRDRERASSNLSSHIRIEGFSAEEWFARSDVVAFLVLHADTLLYERYFNGYDEGSIVPSFSVAKSFVSALTGIALSEGLIEYVDQPVTDFVPELADQGFDRVTIRHLLQMTSGIRFGERYGNPFSDVARFYYGTGLRKRLNSLSLETEPGSSYSYRSVDTELLGLVLERATKMPLSAYLETRIWQPLGMEFDASWSLDQETDGIEKAYCCLNARARDFAKFGLLYLNKGRARERQIIPESWIDESLTPVRIGTRSWRYGYLWWLGDPAEGDYMAEGLHGEYIYIDPLRRTVIVMLCKKSPGVGTGFFREIANSLRRPASR